MQSIHILHLPRDRTGKEYTLLNANQTIRFAGSSERRDNRSDHTIGKDHNDRLKAASADLVAKMSSPKRRIETDVSHTE